MRESRESIHNGAGLEGRRCRSLIQNSFDVFKIIDSAGVILFASPSIENVSGYTPDEMVGTSAFDWIHPDDLALARRTFADVRSGHELAEHIELRSRHRDQSYRIIELSARNLMDDPSVNGIVLNYRDITERKQWEHALRQSEERYQRAFHSSPDSITISLLSSGAFLEVNEGFERITGYSRDEILGKTSLELGVWKDPQARAHVAECLGKGEAVRDFETIFVGKNGVEVVGRLSATVIELHETPCMLATVRDVTAQKQAEEKLRQATEQLRADHEALKEKNIALKEILDHIEEDKAAYRHEVAANIENLMRPVIDRMKSGAGHLTAAEIDGLEARLESIIKDDIDQFQNNLSKLTPREQDICELIRTGRTSKEIAEGLGLSPETIHKHRQAIRRKLQIDHRGINLSSYLRSH